MNRRACQLAVLALVAVLGRAELRADEPPAVPAAGAQAPARSVAQAAESALAAWTAQDGAALAALATHDDPDPWIVANRLVADGHGEAAVAFAEARVVTVQPARLPAGLPTVQFDNRYALARESLAVCLRSTGVRLRAREEFERAAEAYPAEDALPAAEAWILAAELDQVLGSQRHGLLLLARAKNRLRGTGSHAWLGRTLRMESLLQRDLGAFARALRASEAAQAEYLAAKDPRSATLALQDQGDFRVMLGDLSGAERAYEAARVESLRRLDMKGAAVPHGKLAIVNLLRGDHEGARRMLEPGLSALSFVGTPGQKETLLCVLSAIQIRRGDLTSAMSLAERAAQTAQESKQWVSPFTTALLGTIHARLGHFEQALALLDEAHKRAAASPVTFWSVALYSIEAATRLVAGDLPGAREAAHLSVAQVRVMVEGLDEENSAIARQIWFDLYSVGMWASVGLGDVAGAYYFLEAGRAAGLLESLGGRRVLLSHTVPEPLQTAEAEARERLRVADDALNQARGRGAVAVTRGLAAAREEAWRVWEQAVARVQGAASLSADLLTLESAQLPELEGALAEGEALVLYGLGKQATRELLLLPDAEGVALVITRQGARLVPLGPARAIKAACEACDLRDAQGAASEPLARLHQLIVEPLGLGPEVQRVLVSPDGALHIVAFAALLPDKEIAFSPSATVLLRLRAEAAKRGQGILAFGNPHSNLPGSEAEARAIGDVALVGAQATEADFHTALAQQPRWHAVHLASHGQVDPDRPMRSYIELGRVGEEDGRLTALEVFQLRMPADLVVLSACETGRGKVYRGEGLVGLMRAFMSAGAPRVLCSLWKVDDDATRALMLKFYALWSPKDGSPGLSAAAALQAAQAHVRSFERWAHPYYWAAWVLWGLPD